MFRRLPEGSWLIEEWAIWVPYADVHEVPGIIIQPPTRTTPARAAPSTYATKVGLQTTGGHVLRVAFGEETVWRRPIQ